jgi:hypothetical protein
MIDNDLEGGLSGLEFASSKPLLGQGEQDDPWAIK